MWVPVLLFACGGEVVPIDLHPYPHDPPPNDRGTVIDRTMAATSPASVDILMAIDPALEGQVTDQLKFLLDWLSDVDTDWRVGIVSTALGDAATAGVLAFEPIDRRTDPVVIGGLSDVGPYGGLGATFLALQAGANGSFPNAEVVHLVIVSSTDDRTPESLVTPDSWMAFRDQNWPGAPLSVIAPGDSPVLSGVADAVLADVSERLGPAFVEIALQASGRQREFYLTRLPVQDSLEAFADDDLYGPIVLGSSEWTYNPRRNSLTFEGYVPEPGAAVELRYEGLSTASAPR